MTLSRDCPNCGAKDTLYDIPKSRNGIQGVQCGMCKQIFFKNIRTYDHGSSSSRGAEDISTWEQIEGNKMGLKDYEGI